RRREPGGPVRRPGAVLHRPGPPPPRSHGPELLRARDARLVLRGDAVRARARRRPLLHARRQGPSGRDRGEPDERRRLPDVPRPLAPRRPLPGEARRGGGAHRLAAGLRPDGRRGCRPRHGRRRRPRLRRRGARRRRRARQPLARRAHRTRGEPALPRDRDRGQQDLRAPVGVAELGLPASQRRRRARRPHPLRQARAAGLRLPENVMQLHEKIPNNVNLSQDKRLLRALEKWQPDYLKWWHEAGPTDFQADDIYLRTAISVDAKGWAHFDYVKMPDYKWGIFLTPPEPDRRIGFGDFYGNPAWQDVPGEFRNALRRIIVT